jgi:hypothetical protein
VIYQFYCEPCNKKGWKAMYEVTRHHSLAGKPYACPNCGDKCQRIYSAAVEKERLYDDGGKRFSSFSQHEKFLKTKGRVLTEGTSHWKDIQRMAKDGQRRTQLSQKGHY